MKINEKKSVDLHCRPTNLRSRMQTTISSCLTLVNLCKEMTYYAKLNPS
jgi:hypothetical protein